MATPTENFIAAAYNAGIPKDQLENFIKYKYIPLPWQLIFHSQARKTDKDESVEIGVGGARGPGKSYSVFAQVALDDCQRSPRLKCLFLRQTGKAAKESFEDLIQNVLLGKISYSYNIASGVVKFVNGSRILLGGFETARDIDKYIGIEYDLIAIEELNQITEEKVEKLKGSLRSSKLNWKPRMYTSFNPGGLGHGWIKEHFVIPLRENKQYRTRFIPATYKDNPYLNKEYIDYLEELTGNLGKAWREGNWDIFEGQYFNEWNIEVHTCEPFEIPKAWRRYRGYDYGYSNPACCLWFAVDHDGNVWVYKELYYPSGHSTDADKQAKDIAELSIGESYHYSVADPAIFSPTGMVDKSGSETIAEVLLRNNISIIRGSNRRIDGWNTMHRYLKYSEESKPKLIFFKTCFNTIRTIPTLLHDDHRNEDLDTGGEDHSADVIRYFLQTLHESKTPAPLNDVEQKLKKLKKKNFNLNNFYYPE